MKKNRPNEKILILENCTVKFNTETNETCAIKNVSFEVFDKEFLSIVGPSGCGKSTVLSIISGLLPITDGKILKKDDLKIGIMLQQDQLFPWRTVWQNAILGLEITKNSNEKTKKYVKKLLKKYGLGGFIDHFPNQISGGMRQKVALIRTLAIHPDVLLLDEPFSALDFQTRINISDEVRKIIKNEKKTAILVTHDIGEAITVSDRVLVFSKRPAKVKKIFEINFKNDNKKNTCLKKRSSPEFNIYFDNIWKEIEDNES